MPNAMVAQNPLWERGGVQGEGNYKAARAFNEAERYFVASGIVAGAAQAAAPNSEAELRAMLAAEQKGEWLAKEEGPALTKRWPASTTLSLPRKGVAPMSSEPGRACLTGVVEAPGVALEGRTK